MTNLNVSVGALTVAYLNVEPHGDESDGFFGYALRQNDFVELVVPVLSVKSNQSKKDSFDFHFKPLAFRVM